MQSARTPASRDPKVSRRDMLIAGGDGPRSSGPAGRSDTARDGGRDPRWVDAILDWRWTWFTARVALTSAYLFGSLFGLADFPSAVAAQEHFGLHPAPFWAAFTIAVELIGPILIIAGRWVWLGAGMLGVITGVASIIAYPFWTMTGEARFEATITFLEHFGLIAGFVMAALIAEHANRLRPGRQP